MVNGNVVTVPVDSRDIVHGGTSDDRVEICTCAAAGEHDKAATRSCRERSDGVFNLGSVVRYGTNSLT